MSTLPATSISLITTLAQDPQSVRWKDLYTTYAEPLRLFLRTKFPSLEAEDIIQETMLALMQALPNYRYMPDSKGHFRNYLIGIAKHKAMDALAARQRESQARATLAENPPDATPEAEREWQHAALEVALAQLLADPDINPFHRTVFERLVLGHEKPDAIARELGTTRGNVDVIKKRMMERLTASVQRLTAS